MINNRKQFEEGLSKSNEPLRGTVTDCFLLNVRRQPDSNSEVCCILPVLSSIVIDPNFEDKTYHRVIIPALVRRTSFKNVDFSKFYHGYCEKKYIAISEKTLADKLGDRDE